MEVRGTSKKIISGPSPGYLIGYSQEKRIVGLMRKERRVYSGCEGYIPERINIIRMETCPTTGSARKYQLCA